MNDNTWADGDDRYERVDWAASCRLALVVSVVAALIVVALASFVAVPTLIVTIIVAATAASWFHLEHGHLTRPAHLRRD